MSSKALVGLVHGMQLPRVVNAGAGPARSWILPAASTSLHWQAWLFTRWWSRQPEPPIFQSVTLNRQGDARDLYLGCSYYVLIWLIFLYAYPETKWSIIESNRLYHFSAQFTHFFAVLRDPCGATHSCPFFPLVSSLTSNGQAWLQMTTQQAAQKRQKH